MPRNAHWLQSSDTVSNVCTKLNHIAVQLVAAGYSPRMSGFDPKVDYVDCFLVGAAVV
jgi:hypothetical protein